MDNVTHKILSHRLEEIKNRYNQLMLQKFFVEDTMKGAGRRRKEDYKTQLTILKIEVVKLDAERQEIYTDLFERKSCF